MNRDLVHFEVPNNWTWIKLSEICLPIERTNQNYQEPGKEFYYIDIEAIDNNSQTIKELKAYKWNNAPSRAQQMVQVDDILFATVRPYLKNIAMVNSKQENAIASSGFCILRTTIVNAKYVFYYVSSQSFINSVNQYAKGTSYPAVTNKIILDLKIPMPLLNQQLLIVSKIEELFSKFNIGVQSLLQIESQLKIYRATLLKSAFEGKLTEKWRVKNKENQLDHIKSELEIEQAKYYKQKIDFWKSEVKRWKKSGEIGSEPLEPKPSKKINIISVNEGKHWSMTTLESVGELNSGQHILEKNHNDKNIGIPYLTGPSDFGEVFPVCSRWSNFPKVIAYSDDILITVKGSGVGKINMMNFEGAIGRQIMSFRSYYNNKWFLYYFLLSQFKSIKDMSSGTAIPGISREHILSLQCPLVSSSEQEIIVQEIRSQFSVIENLEGIITSSLTELNLLKQGILDKAFQGKLVPNQNTTAESWEEILKSIVASKALTEENLIISRSKKMKPTQKMLIDILKEKFNDGSFTFDQIKDNILLPYDDLKNQLFQLLEENENLASSFDVKKEKILYKIVK